MFCVRVSSGSYHVIIKVDMPLESSCNGLFISHNKKIWMKFENFKNKSRLETYFPPMFLISRCAKQATIANHIFTSPALQSRRWFLSNIFSRNPLMAAARVRWLQSLFIFLFLPDSFLLQCTERKKGQAGEIRRLCLQGGLQTQSDSATIQSFPVLFLLYVSKDKESPLSSKTPFWKVV